MHRPALPVLALLLASCATPADQLPIHLDGRPVLTYQRAAVSWASDRERAHYIHPLFDLDGNVLTENSPADHPHQHGVYWSWHQLWLGDQRLGDPWEDRDFRWDVTDVSLATAGTAQVLRTAVAWKSPLHRDASGAMETLVREHTTITVHPAREDRQYVDFEIRLTALVPDLRLGGSEDAKGYGGFSARLRLPEDVGFLGSLGPVEPENLALPVGPWVDVSATFGPAGGPSGVTLLQHPTVPGFPQPWILRRAGSMQNAVYPGRTPVPLSMDRPLVLRHRLVVHRGRITLAQGNRWQDEYAQGSEKD